MTATIHILPVSPIVRLGDRDTAAARGRIAGRYCKHIAIANRQGFVEDIARISGVVMAKMGGGIGTRRG